MRQPPPWFICDATNFPAVFVFERTNQDVRVAEYDKPNGAITQRIGYFIATHDFNDSSKVEGGKLNVVHRTEIKDGFYEAEADYMQMPF